MYIIGTILILLSAIPDAIVDTVNFYFYDSIFNTARFNSQWWNLHISWENKYIIKWKWLDNKVWRYLKKTLFVPFTDAWHCFGTIYVLMLCCGAFLVGASDKVLWLKILTAFGGLALSKGIFEMLISKLLKK